MTNLIIYRSHHHAPMSIEDEHMLVGIFIVLNIIWIASLLWQKVVIKKEYGALSDFNEILMTPVMIIIWALIIIFSLGYCISKLIF